MPKFPNFKLPHVSTQTIARLCEIVGRHPKQTPDIDKLQQQFASPKGLLVRSVTNAERRYWLLTSWHRLFFIE